MEKLKKEDFEKYFSLMTDAFPPEEYRPKEKQYAILDDENYHATVLKEGNDVTAFIAAWNIGNFRFIEHFAVSATKRNCGIGSSFMKEYLKNTPFPLVLEVENKDDELSRRRIGFYQRLGFVLSEICYDQPNFQNTGKRIPLRIMYNKNGKELDLHTVKSEIFQKVYKRSENTETE